MESIKSELEEKGYVIVPNVLSESDILEYRSNFDKWYNSTPNLKNLHNKIDPHGIFKFHEVGHQRFAWLIRTHPKVIEIFKYIWEVDELVVSFDGSCYMSNDMEKKDKYWTHTDQSSEKKGLHCYQGLVSLTSNVERSLVVYEGSHKLHEKYFTDNNIISKNNWCVINKEYTDQLKDSKKILNIKAGSLVIWDSRTFHQNTCGSPLSEEERLVQYLCYLPKNNEKNTAEIQEDRRICYRDYRTTNHWPYPMGPIALQPNYYNYLYSDNLKINYNELPEPDLTGLEEKIEKLL